MEENVQKKVKIFFTTYKKKNYKKGEILIRAEEDPPGIFYLTRGKIRQYFISTNGTELVVNIFKPISFLPMSWAINSTNNKYFFEAITDLEVYIAPRNDTIRFIKENPDVLFDLIRRVYKGTDGILNRMTHLMSGNAYARIITEIIIQSERFGIYENDDIRLNISEAELAALSGMTRETVSREIKKLKDKNFVSYNAHELIVHSLKKLEEELRRL